MASAAGLGWPDEAGADSGDGVAGGVIPRLSRALGLGWPAAAVSREAQVPVPVRPGSIPMESRGTWEGAGEPRPEDWGRGRLRKPRTG